MSFGLSSGGGQVRYAVVVTDQATQPLRNISTSFNSLATTSTSVSGKMSIMNNTFSASVNPIKNTGDAMNQLVTTHKTLGSQLGSIASGFKNNALAIGAAASSVLGLYQNYANLSSAQNAANKSATAAKAAQNSVTTATKALNKAIDQYGRGSKEAKAAQDKLTVAQERAVNKTESAKIAQDNLNQTMADFGINILPNVLLAGGSITSIFDNIDLKGRSLTGIVTKLGGTFSGLGTGIAGAATSFITGGKGLDGFKEKLKGAGTQAIGLKGSLMGMAVTGAVIGGVTFAALELADAMNQVIKPFSTIKQPVSILEASIDKTGKSMATFNQTLAETDVMMTAGVSPAIVALDATFKTHMTETLLKNAGFLDENGKKTKLFTDAIAAMTEKLKESGQIGGKAISDLGEGFTHTSAEFTKWSTEMLNSGKTAKQVAQWLIDSHIKESQALTILTAAMIAHSQSAGEVAKNLELQTHAFEGSVKSINLASKAYLDVNNTIAAVNPKVMENSNKIKENAAMQKAMSSAVASSTKFVHEQDFTYSHFGDTLDNLKKKFGAINDNVKPIKFQSAGVVSYYKALAAVGSTAKTTVTHVETLSEKTKRLADQNKVGADFIKRFADANAIAADKMDDFNIAIQAGNDKFNAFVTSSELGAVTAKRYHDALLQTVGAQVQLPPALDLTTSQLEEVQHALDNAKVGLTENANAAGILADALDAQLAPSIQKLGGALTALSSKEFKKAFKDLDFGEAGKKFKSFASDLDRDISKINKESGRMETIFSQLSVALSIDKLPPKQWVAGLEGMSKAIEKIAKTQKIDLSGITAFIAKAESIKDPVQLAKYQKVLALIISSSKGGFNPTELNAIATAIAQTGESSGTAAPKLDAAQTALVKFGREASAVVTITASMSASMVSSVGTAVDFVVKALSSIASIQVPTPNESKYQKGLQLAIDNAEQTYKFIKKSLDKIASIKVPTPNEKIYQKGLQLAIDNAAQTKKFIDKELQKISSIKVPAPKFNNFNSALDQAVSDAKRAVRDINNALKKINKPSSGGGGGNGSGPGATTGPFAQGGTVIANQRTTATFGEAGPELAMFVPLKGGGMRSVGSGRGTGDNVEVVNVINIMDETIMRRITARSGRNRFTLGV